MRGKEGDRGVTICGFLRSRHSSGVAKLRRKEIRENKDEGERGDPVRGRTKIRGQPGFLGREREDEGE